MMSVKFGEFDGAGHRPMMAMLEVTNRCNMDCPLCFSDANHPADDVPFAEIERRLRQLLAVSDGPIPVQLSGGEPTVRKDLPEIVELARRLGFFSIELITNGIALAARPDLARELRDRGLTAVYLQFDGLSKETYWSLRGRDMTEVRSGAIEAARRADLCVTLAVAVTRGVNDGELGHVVRFAAENADTVRAINFQSATRFTGRFELNAMATGVSRSAEGASLTPHLRHAGYTLPELLALIEAQTGIERTTFVTPPMGHPLCNAMSWVFLVGGRLEPLFRYVDPKDFYDFLGDDGRGRLHDLFRGKGEFFRRQITNPKAWKLVRQAARLFGSAPFGMFRAKRVLVFAKSFMEREALDPARIERCCYGITGTEGVYSFCAFNNLYRFPGRTNARSHV